MSKTGIANELKILDETLVQLEEQLFDQKLLEYENEPAPSRLETFYEAILQAVGPLTDDPERPWKSRVVVNYNVCKGLKTVDLYLPDWDIVIEFDGPPHFF